MARRRRSSRKFSFGAPDGLQPGDDLGNRFKKGQGQLPPDDIGNRKDPEDNKPLPPDEVGNRIDINPTHSHSGVLADLDKRKNRRRPKGAAPLVRIGRYFVGGVNPIVAGNTARAMKAHEEHEEARSSAHQEEGRRRRHDENNDISERRIKRFFDFQEDDRFDYALTTAPEDKRALAEDTIQNVLTHSGREAKVQAHLIEDGTRPKVLVTIDEKGAHASIPEDRRSDDSDAPIFVLGNNALMSLNYLANKIVNRYPSDRIRLAILPQSHEQEYRDALSSYQEKRALKDENNDEGKAKSKRREPRAKDEAKVDEAPRRNIPKPAPPKSTARKEPFERVSLSAIGSGEVSLKESAPKKVTKKASTKKVTQKGATKKVAKKAATKKVTKKAATKKVAKKAATKKVAKKAATKKVTKKKAAKKTTKKAKSK